MRVITAVFFGVSSFFNSLAHRSTTISHDILYVYVCDVESRVHTYYYSYYCYYHIIIHRGVRSFYITDRTAVFTVSTCVYVYVYKCTVAVAYRVLRDWPGRRRLVPHSIIIHFLYTLRYYKYTTNWRSVLAAAAKATDGQMTTTKTTQPRIRIRVYRTSVCVRIVHARL